MDGGGAQLLELGEPLLVGLGALLAHGARDPTGPAAPLARSSRGRGRSGAASRSPAGAADPGPAGPAPRRTRAPPAAGAASRPPDAPRRPRGRRPPPRRSGGPRAAG